MLSRAPRTALVSLAFSSARSSSCRVASREASIRCATRAIQKTAAPMTAMRTVTKRAVPCPDVKRPPASPAMRNHPNRTRMPATAGSIQRTSTPPTPSDVTIAIHPRSGLEQSPATGTATKARAVCKAMCVRLPTGP